MDALRADLDEAMDADAVDAILAREDVQRAQDRATNGARKELDAMINAAIARTAPPAADDGDGWPGPDTSAGAAA